MLNAKQVMEDISLCGACSDGIEWASGKTSDDIWNTKDSFAVKYLVWWALKNAGQPGWKNLENIRNAITAISEATYPLLGTMKKHVQENVNLSDDPCILINRFEQEVIWENPDPIVRETYLANVLSIVKNQLRPSL